ncbi:hypothetical protein OKW21_000567 [Catalinimonas alkaloidigena]|uniref:T9SS type A sorting domain-containing protein n=1 Tax=Catalinimonas alkaloidigena TaxID=1075417 RepID=UPI00240573DF|nr:T9SS type A sorting domain-containing protein [Catalinimonas alkaloidigena]MDF9795304.1 hypothetical protein [Catalinimonas alkaloidigena]
MLVFSFSAFGQNYTATSNGDGTWLSSGTWTADGSVGLPPNGAWTGGTYIIIDDIVDIAVNKTVDLSSSSVSKIIIKSSGSIVFKSNSKLILPENTTIEFESGGTVIASNNSKGTLIQIGENGVWGNECDGCTSGSLEGPGEMNKNSTPNQPLPIKLLSFTGQANMSSIQLDWVTAFEENFDYFTLERAGADLKFKAIGNVNGTGDSTAEIAYDFTDTNPLQGQAFYRLKATDYDGSVEYHKTISVHYNGFTARVNNTTVYPNLVTNHTLTVISDTEMEEIRLMDFSGRTVYKQTTRLDSNKFSLPSSVKPGAYLLIVLSNNGKQHQQKIMII